MINGGRNRSRNPCQADLSYATRSIFVQNKIRIIQKRYVDLWSIGIYCHAIICQVVVDRMSSLRIVARFFKERHTDAHHDRALDLITGRTLIYDSATIDDGYNPSDSQASNPGIPGHLGKVSSKGMRGIFWDRVWVEEGSF